MISIIMQCKNDNYLGNFMQRFEICIRKQIENIKELGITNDIQIVLTDWGSEIKLIDSMNIDFSLIKYIYVSPEIANKYNGDAKYSYVHPINVSARNSDGDIILWGDSDGFLPIESLKLIYELSKDNEKNSKFYWGSRYHIDLNDYVNSSISDIDSFIKNNSNLRHDKWTASGGAAGIYLLRRDMFFESTGFSEKLIYWGWQDIDFHNRLASRYVCGGDMEDIGVKIYHLEHYEPNKRNVTTRANHQINYPFKANPDNWGLFDEKLEIIYKKNK